MPGRLERDRRAGGDSPVEIELEVRMRRRNGADLVPDLANGNEPEVASEVERQLGRDHPVGSRRAGWGDLGAHRGDTTLDVGRRAVDFCIRRCCSTTSARLVESVGSVSTETTKSAPTRRGWRGCDRENRPKDRRLAGRGHRSCLPPQLEEFPWRPGRTVRRGGRPTSPEPAPCRGRPSRCLAAALGGTERLGWRLAARRRHR